MNKRYTLVLDTETVSNNKGFSLYGNYVFDIGATFCVIEDNNITVLDHVNFLVEEIYNDEELMKNYFFGEDRLNSFYKENNDIDIVPWSEILDFFNSFITCFNIEDYAAFNITFDMNSIQSTCDKLKTNNPFKDLTKVDLYNKSCQALADDENYKIFCVENGRMTEKGNIKADAESVFAYLFNEPSVIESHTALSDAILETKIYQWLLKQEKEQDTFFEDKPNTQAWRLVQYKKRKK